MIRLLTLALLVSAFSVLAPGRGSAQGAGAPPGVAPFMDCRTNAFFLQAVRLRFPKFVCRSFATAITSGFPVRFLADASDTTLAAQEAGMVAAMDELVVAANRAAEFWTAIYPIKLGPVTVIMGAPATPMERVTGTRFRGLTFSPGSPSDPQECLVAIDVARVIDRAPVSGSIPDDLKFTMAHELGHCVQRVTFGAFANGGDWWVEGTASLLASIVAGGAEAQFVHEREFLQRIPGTPLTALSYEAVLFFQWMRNRDAKSVFELIKTMARVTEADQEAQRRGLTRALGGGMEARRAMADFAVKLADNDIPNPDGGLVGRLQPGAPLVVEGAGEFPIPGDPFTVQLRPVVFRGGTYLAEVKGAWLSHRVKEEGGGWSDDFPMLAGSTDCEKEARYLLAVVRMDEDTPVTLSAMKGEACRKEFVLSGPLSVDACVLGAWTVDGEARRALLAGWLQKEGAVSGVSGSLRFTFAADNTAEIIASGFAADIDATTEPASHIHVGVDGRDAGQWSASGGVLQYKSGGGSLALDITVEVAGMTVSVPDRAAFEDGTWAYTCGGDSMEIRYTGPAEVLPGKEPRFTLRRGP